MGELPDVTTSAAARESADCVSEFNPMVPGAATPRRAGDRSACQGYVRAMLPATRSHGIT